MKTNPAPTRPAYTPGPWTVDNQYIHGPDGIRFLAVAGDGAGQANARLIASAPALLAALESIMEWTDIHAEQTPIERRELLIRNAARAAIAKAKGGEK